MSWKCVPTTTPKWNGRRSVYGLFCTASPCAEAVSASASSVIMENSFLMYLYNGANVIIFCLLIKKEWRRGVKESLRRSKGVRSKGVK